MNERFLTKKRLIVAIIAIMLAAVILFVLDFGFLTITSSTEEEKIIYVRSNKDSSSRNFTLKQGSKRLLLPRGEYTVEVSRGDKFSSYQRSLGILSGNELEVEILSQKADVFLGKTGLPCAKQAKDGAALFYSCRQNNGLTILSDRQRPKEHQEESDAGGRSQNFSAVLKSYADDFVEAEAVDNKLTVRLRDDKGQKPGSQPLTLTGFGGSIYDSTFSVASSGSFSAFDTSSNTVWLFGDSRDQNPAKIKIDAKKIDKHATITILAGPNYTFLVNMHGVEHIENHGGEPEESKSPDDARIIVVDNKQKKIIKEQKIPADLISRDIIAGSGDSLLFLLSGNHEGQAHTYTLESGLQKAGVLPKGIQRACWKDNDSFYYSADAGRAIYLHSLAKQASFLIYTNRTNFVSNLSCAGDQLYFALSISKGEDTNKLAHYRLGDPDQVGTRLNEVLPFYYTFNRDTFRLEEASGSVTVTLSYDSDRNGVPSKDKLKQKMAEILKEKGVEAPNINLQL